jgi:predicted SprT family Zn-dependent metalloprotease
MMKMEPHEYIQHQLAAFMGNVDRQYEKGYIVLEEREMIKAACTKLSKAIYERAERCEHSWVTMDRHRDNFVVYTCGKCGGQQLVAAGDKPGKYSDAEKVFGLPWKMLTAEEKTGTG